MRSSRSLTITLALIATAATFHAAREWHHRLRETATGVPVQLLHTCDWKEAFRTIGDDRVVVVTHRSDGAMKLNELVMSPAAGHEQLRKMFETRAEKFYFVMGGENISYKNLVTALVEDHKANPDASILLITPTMQAAARSQLFCPSW